MSRDKLISGSTMRFTVLTLCVIIVFIIFCVQDVLSGMDKIDSYADEFAINTSDYVTKSFKNYLSSIETDSYLYGASVKSSIADLDALKSLEDKSDFDFIRFISSDGTDYASNGSTADCGDRAYFRQGMNGESGITEVLSSRINGEKLIGFYTPVEYEGNVIGVMVGFMGQKSISEIIGMDFFDHPAETCILRNDGTILGRYNGENITNKGNIFDLSGYVQSRYLAETENAIKTGSQYCFRVNTSNGRTSGCVTPIDGTDWVLIQIFPSAVASSQLHLTGQSSFWMLVFICIMFVFYVYVSLSNRRKRTRILEEIAKKEKIDYLLHSLANDFVCLIDVDLECETEERFMTSEDLPEWGGRNENYTDNITKYAELVVCERDRENFLKATEINTIKDCLSKQSNFFIEYDTTDDRHFQGKFTIADNEKGKPHMLVSIRDISENARERVEYNKKLEKAFVAAETASRAKTTFLFNMSHDIRTPMNAIVGYSELADRSKDDRAKLDMYLRKIKFASDHMLRLINGVLEMARIETRGVTLDLEATDINEACLGACTLLETAAAARKIRYTTSINTNGLIGMADRTRLEEVLVNIISNAVKYTGEGGEVNVDINASPAGDNKFYLDAVIADNGIGMSKEFLPHIFESFERERKAETISIQGTGLGMGITKCFVDAMGGTINIESEQGEGTTVRIHIPIEAVENSETGKKADKDIDLAIFEGKRLLLVEDNELNREIATEILLDFGFSVECAEDGVVAVNMVQNSEDKYYDAILMDIQMPNMDGYKATSIIRSLENKEKAEIPIIAMTANAFAEDKIAAMNAGMNGHVSKPIDIDKLYEALAEFIK